ncbi:MAG TPA: filamentous hemagglutinin N-terminal domain-containing protein, partial [Caulobacteraceae bacterium]|nr:filamentous hemagglutinin N-terminal domain-containing protein [Caulobacteraceae bacterium]
MTALVSAKSPEYSRRAWLMTRAAAPVVVLAASLLTASLLASGAQALPTGPSSTNPVSGGTAPVITSPGSGQLNVQLNNPRTIIDWNTFSIASGETVSFLFQTNSSIVLNRVPTGSATIAGTMNGCVVSCPTYGGNIWIYAPDGVIFGAGAVVNTGGLLATSSPMTTLDSDFVGGTEVTPNQFTFGTSSPSAVVDIQATASITGHGGTLAFVAPTVTSEAGATVSTTATTSTGANSVLYGAANAFTIQFMPDVAGDLDLIDFIVPAGSESTVAAPIALAGTTSSGNIYIAAVSNLADAMISTTGSLTATTAMSVGGNIVLSAGAGISNGAPGTPAIGAAANDISLGAAMADQAITVVGTGAVTLTDNITATNQAVSITANGGDLTQATGAITGADVTLSSSGQIDLTNPAGVAQDYSVTAMSFADSTLSPSFTPGRDFTVDALGALTLGASLTAPRNLSVTAAGALDTSGATQTATTGALTLQGGAGLTVGATTATGGATSFTTTSGDITLTGAVDAAGQTATLTSAGAIAQSGGIITASALTGSAGTSVTLNDANAVGALSGFFATTGFSYTSAAGFSAGQIQGGASASLTASTGDLTLSDDVSGDVTTLTATTGAINQTAGFVGATTLNLSAATGIALNDTNAVDNLGMVSNTTAGGIGFINNSDLILTGAVTASGQAVNLESMTGALGQTGGVITAGTLSASGATGVTLNGANVVSNLGAVGSAAGGISFTDANGFSITGAVTASGQTVNLAATTGAIDQTAGVITAGTLTASAVTGISLTDANQVTTLGTLTNPTSGGIAFKNVGAITLAQNFSL